MSKNPKKQWLRQTMDSVIASDFDQYILIDDASDKPIEDATYRIKKGLGIGNARNVAAELCTGDIIASMDDDDYFIPEAVERLKKFVQENPNGDIYHFPCRMIGDLEGLWGDNYDMSRIIEQNQIPAASWIRKSVLEKEKYIMKTPEDWDMWIRLHQKGYKFIYFPEPIYVHRMRHGSLSAPDSQFAKDFDRIRQELKKKYEK